MLNNPFAREMAKRLEEQLRSVEAQILAGACTSFEQYREAVAMRTQNLIARDMVDAVDRLLSGATNEEQP